MRRSVNPNSKEEVRRELQRLNGGTDSVLTAIALHTSTYNHANYDTAYAWGDHAGLYDPAGTMTTHEGTYNHANYDTAYGWGDHAGLYDPAGTMTTHEGTYTHANIATAFGWGDHAGLYDVTGTAAGLVGAHEGTYDHPFYDAIGTFFNGTFQETFDALVTSTGGVVTMSLQQTGGGDLTMQFSDGRTTLDCTAPVQTIVLTAAGTDASPVAQYVYIPQSTKVLTVGTEWPDAVEHIKVGYFLVPSPAFVEDHGVYVNQNWNDHQAGINSQGHLSHITMKLRHLGATWFSGVSPNGTTASYYTIGAGATDWLSAAGVISQVHHQAFAAIDTTGAGIISVKNWWGAGDGAATPYYHIDNLFDIAADSTGAAISNNRYFSLVFWGVANKGGEYSPIMVNLPSGNYVLQADATTDPSSKNDYTLPREYTIDSGTAFLICRSTFKMGATWTHIETEDLRGQKPLNSPGSGGSGASDHGALGGLADDDHTAYHTDARAATWLAAGHETTYNHANYDTAYGWGDHAGLYDPAGTMTTHESTYNHANYNTAYGWGDHAGVYVPIADAGKVKVDAAATADYLGAAFNDGTLRTSTGITFTDGGNFVTLTTNDSEIAHGSLSGYDANDHIDHTGVTLTAGSGLSGGGTIASSRTFALDINGLDVATINGADTVAFYDDASGVNKKAAFTSFNSALDHGALGGKSDDDHTSYHTDARAATWLAAGHETTYDHTAIGTGVIANLVDDAELFFGTGSDYWFIYNSTGTQFELWTTNADGGGTDGIVMSVDDGTDDVTFTGDLSVSGTYVNIGSTRLVYDASASFAGSFFMLSSDGGDHLTGTGSEGTYNTGIGALALQKVTKGYFNLAVGSVALQDLTTGGYNTAVGTAALGDAIDNDDNVAIGNTCLRFLSSGDSNTGIGKIAAAYIADGITAFTTYNNCVYIGFSTRGSANGITNEVAIGSSVIGGGSNTVTIGNTSNTDVYFTGVLHGDGSGLTGVGSVGDDAAISLGADTDYWFIYNSALTQFEFWSTNVGSGVDGKIMSVNDGTGVIDFYKIIDCVGINSVAPTGVRGFYATSVNYEAVRGDSTTSTGVSGHSTTATAVEGHSIQQFAGYFHRNADAGTTTGEVFRIVQDHAGDDQPCMTIYQDGTGDILQLKDGGSNVVNFKDGGDTDFTGIVKAGGYKSSDGTAGATTTVAVAKVGGGTRTLNFKNGLYIDYTDS